MTPPLIPDEAYDEIAAVITEEADRLQGKAVEDEPDHKAAG